MMNDDEYDPRRISAEDLPDKPKPPTEVWIELTDGGRPFITTPVNTVAHRYVPAPEGSAVITTDEVQVLWRLLDADDMEGARARALDDILRAARGGAS